MNCDKQFGAGDCKYGNFYNYYEFNQPERRITLLPSSFLKTIINKYLTTKLKIHVLDIGCNSGELTEALQSHFEIDCECEYLAVDIDPILIDRCKARPSDIVYKVCDLMKDADRKDVVSKYFDDNKIDGFDVIFCFSVTLWIHINNGDEQFKDFLRYLSNSAAFLIIEPQPWKCYRNAVRRAKRNGSKEFQHFKGLKWRTSIIDDITNYLVNECSCTLLHNLGETKQWIRPILVFKCS